MEQTFVNNIIFLISCGNHDFGEAVMLDVSRIVHLLVFPCSNSSWSLGLQHVFNAIIVRGVASARESM